jgi:hypothetical protein
MKKERAKFIRLKKASVTIQRFMKKRYRTLKVKNTFRIAKLKPILEKLVNRKYRESFEIITYYSSHRGIEILREKLRKEEEKINRIHIAKGL